MRLTLLHGSRRQRFDGPGGRGVPRPGFFRAPAQRARVELLAHLLLIGPRMLPDEDDEAERGPTTISGFDASPLGALDLMALASRATARIACEQSIAVEAAARLLERAALSETIVWVAGDAADEHTHRLETAGHKASTLVDLNRLPARVRQGDLLFITAVFEPPLSILEEAQRRAVELIVLTGAERISLESGVTLFVPCHDARAVELAHSFIVTALCAPNLELDRAESAA